MDFSFFVISLKRTPNRLEKFRANNAGTAIRFEHEIVPGILMGGGFSVRYPSQQDLDAFVRGRGQVALQRLNLCFGICAYAISPTGARKPPAKGLSDGQQTQRS